MNEYVLHQLWSGTPEQGFKTFTDVGIEFTKTRLLPEYIPTNLTLAKSKELEPARVLIKKLCSYGPVEPKKYQEWFEENVNSHIHGSEKMKWNESPRILNVRLLKGFDPALKAIQDYGFNFNTGSTRFGDFINSYITGLLRMKLYKVLLLLRIKDAEESEYESGRTSRRDIEYLLGNGKTKEAAKKTFHLLGGKISIWNWTSNYVTVFISEQKKQEIFNTSASQKILEKLYSCVNPKNVLETDSGISGAEIEAILKANH